MFYPIYSKLSGSTFACIVLLFLAFFGRNQAFSQVNGNVPSNSSLENFVSSVYGVNHELVNGLQYYNAYYRILYHPYYMDDHSHPGKVRLSGKIFDKLMINYDLYSQNVIMEFLDRGQGLNKVVLCPNHIESFEIEGYYFEKLELDKNGPLIYQVIRKNDLTFFIHWEKKIQQVTNQYPYAELFTDPLRSYFLESEGRLYSFHNRRSFAALFSGASKKQLKKYFRQNILKFNEMSIEDLESVLTYISVNNHNLAED